MGSNAVVATSFCGGSLSVVEDSNEETREEEGAEREVEDEDVVEEAVVLEAEELGGCGDCDGKTNAVGYADEDGANVEGSRESHG